MKMEDHGYNAPLMHTSYKGYRFYSSASRKSVDQLETFEFRSDDVLIISYPKSGTHWMTEIVKLILWNGFPDQVHRGDEQWCMENLSLDNDTGVASFEGEKMTMCEVLGKQPSPRVCVSHVHLKLAPPQVWVKNIPVIYVGRGFKDVVTSRYNFEKNVVQQDVALSVPSFDTMLNNCLEGNVPYNSWFDHVKGYWDVRDRENLLYVTYEELQKDNRGNIKSVANFLKRNLDEDTIERIVTNSKIDKMRANHDATGGGVSRKFLMDCGLGDFMHKGISEQWKEFFTVAQSEKVDKIYKERMKGYEELTQRLTV